MLGNIQADSQQLSGLRQRW